MVRRAHSCCWYLKVQSTRKQKGFCKTASNKPWPSRSSAALHASSFDWKSGCLSLKERQSSGFPPEKPQRFRNPDTETYTYMYMHIHTCIYTYVFMCIYVCIYLHVYKQNLSLSLSLPLSLSVGVEVWGAWGFKVEGRVFHSRA